MDLRGPRGHRGQTGTTKDTLVLRNSSITLPYFEARSVASTDMSTTEVFKGILFVKVSVSDVLNPGIYIYFNINSDDTENFRYGGAIYVNYSATFAEVCIPVTGDVFNVELINQLGPSEINVDCSLLGVTRQVTNKLYLSRLEEFDTNPTPTSSQFGGFTGSIPAGSNIIGNLNPYGFGLGTTFVVRNVDGDIIFRMDPEILTASSTDDFYVPFDFVTQTDQSDGFLFTFEGFSDESRVIRVYVYATIVFPEP